jgi:tRNA 2-thiouridine synthesizing protein C
MRTLIVIDKSPYADWQGREALDMAFALAAFDQPVALLFQGAGVNWLRSGHDAGAVGQKNVDKTLSAAELFGMDAVYADQPSVARYGIDIQAAPTTVTLVQEYAETIKAHDHVVCL